MHGSKQLPDGPDALTAWDCCEWLVSPGVSRSTFLEASELRCPLGKNLGRHAADIPRVYLREAVLVVQYVFFGGFFDYSSAHVSSGRAEVF